MSDEIEKYTLQFARAHANLMLACIKHGGGGAAVNGDTAAVAAAVATTPALAVSKKRAKPEAPTEAAKPAAADDNWSCACAKSGIRGGAACPTPECERNKGKTMVQVAPNQTKKFHLCQSCAKWYLKNKPKEPKAEGAGGAGKKRQKKLTDAAPAKSAAPPKEPSEDEEERANQLDHFEGEVEEEEGESFVDEDELGAEIE